MTEETFVQTVRHLRADDVKQLISEKYNVPVKDITCEGYYSFKFTTKELLNKSDKADE